MSNKLSGIICIIILALGGVLTLYLGFWVCFVGGIAQMVDAFNATPIEGVNMGLGFLRFSITGLVIWGTIVGTIGSISLLGVLTKKNRHG